ncbi:MAG: hypothetical protein AB1774_10455, partial [Bacillota bacterium]
MAVSSDSAPTPKPQPGPISSARVAAAVCSIVAIGLSVFEIWANSFSLLPTLKVNTIHLAFLMMLCFLLYPAKRGAARKT